MALVYKDRVKQTVDAPSTTDPFDFDSNGATPTGYQSFVDALADADTCIYAAEDASGNWETGLGTWAEANNTLTRTTILASSNSGSAETFTGTVTVFITAEASQVRNAHLRTVAAAPTTAGITGEVGVMRVLDISGLTADRDFTLPAVCAVGDRVGVMISTGDDSYELLLKPATDDTINGGAASAEWSRLFITGEVVIFRCVTANAAWVVEYDGRIAQKGQLVLSADCDGESANTSTLPTSASTPGSWATANVVGIGYTTATGRLTVRRAGLYMVYGICRNKDTFAADGGLLIQLYKDGGAIANGYAVIVPSNYGSSSISMLDSAVADNYYQMYYQTTAGNIGLRGNSTTTILSVVEKL